MKRQKLFQQLNNNFLSIQSKQIPLQQKQFNQNEYFIYQLENYDKFQSLLNYKNELYDRFKQKYYEQYINKQEEVIQEQENEISDYFKPAQVQQQNRQSNETSYEQSNQYSFKQDNITEFDDLDKAFQEELNQLYGDYIQETSKSQLNQEISQNLNTQELNSNVISNQESQFNDLSNKESVSEYYSHDMSQSQYNNQEQQKQYINDDNLEKKQKKREKKKEKRNIDLTDQECYQKFATTLQREISDFDASNDDTDYKREKKIDYAAGKLIQNNAWTNNQIQMLKAYVYYIQSANKRLHFGPIVKLVAKSKRQIWKKYNALYTSAFTEEETQRLVELVKTQIKENCYVNFKQIAGQLGKNPTTAIHQYCMHMESRWDVALDAKILEYLRQQVIFPPFLGLLAYDLGIYETAIKRRAERLGFFKPKPWSDDEDQILKHLWTNRANKKEANKAEILDALPDRFAFDIRRRLIQLGLEVDKVLWI